jgi:uncharacterized protein YkwD
MVPDRGAHLRTAATAPAAALAATLACGLVLALVGSLAPAGAATMDSSRGTSVQVAEGYADRVLGQLNQRRTARGLKPVKAATCVDSHAQSWASRLDRRDAFAHSDLGRLMSKCSLRYANENLAMVQDGARPAEVVRLWMRSPGHRRNVLAPQARIAGVSLRWDATRHSWIAVLNFARR